MKNFWLDRRMIKPGDYVQLKSGGPVMIVVKVYNRNALCMWGSILNAHEFAVECLKKEYNEDLS